VRKSASSKEKKKREKRLRAEYYSLPSGEGWGGAKKRSGKEFLLYRLIS